MLYEGGRKLRNRRAKSLEYAVAFAIFIFGFLGLALKIFLASTKPVKVEVPTGAASNSPILSNTPVTIKAVGAAKFRDFWNLALSSIFLSVAGGGVLGVNVSPIAGWAWEALMLVYVARSLFRIKNLSVTIDDGGRTLRVSGFFRDQVIPYSSIYAFEGKRSLNNAVVRSGQAGPGALMISVNVQNQRLVKIAATAKQPDQVLELFRALAGRLQIKSNF
jgi:hypothetical protein